MLDHITIAVTDFPKAKTFYDDALGTLGVSCFYSNGKTAAGYGTEAMPYFWIALKDVVQTGTHVAFSAPDRATVERFYRAALQAGGRDNGAPGLRPQYGPTYYGAFVLDSDGHNYRGGVPGGRITAPKSAAKSGVPACRADFGELAEG